MTDSPKSLPLPGPEDRTLVIGRTGSGKTVFALWLFSMVYEKGDRWIVIDFKREHQIAQIPYVQYISMGVIPSEPGVYVVQPMPDQQDELNDYLMQVWDAENIGLYIDEGVMLANSSALDAILIQGRSKHIPVIMATQRPVGISRYAFSESQYFVVFPSHDKRERKTISEFTPLFAYREDLDEILLPPYHSYWYDVVRRKLHKLAPVPNIPVIMRTFAVKLKPPEPEVQLKEQIKAERVIAIL